MKILAPLLLQAVSPAIPPATPPTADIPLQASAQSPTRPTSLTSDHVNDIGCVAILGLVADQQKRGVAGFDRFGDFAELGSAYAADVGERVIKETAQPRDVVALAMQQSAREQLPLLDAKNREKLNSRMDICLSELTITVQGSELSADDYLQCAARVSLLLDQGDERLGNEALLYENLTYRYKVRKYRRSSDVTVFARADVLKYAAGLKKNGDTVFDNQQIKRCVEIGT